VYRYTPYALQCSPGLVLIRRKLQSSVSAKTGHKQAGTSQESRRLEQSDPSDGKELIGASKAGVL
jgi:hypothetical protein